jgi:hypothetical protein
LKLKIEIMRYLIEVDWSNETANRAISDPKFGGKIQALLKEVNNPTACCGALGVREYHPTRLRTRPLSSPQQTKGYSAENFIKAETAYFTTVKRHKGGYVVVNVDDASQMLAMAEPFSYGLILM